MTPELQSTSSKRSTFSKLACGLFAGALLLAGASAAHAQSGLVAYDLFDSYVLTPTGVTINGLNNQPPLAGTVGWGGGFPSWVTSGTDVTIYETPGAPGPEPIEVNFQGGSFVSGGSRAITVGPVNGNRIAHRSLSQSLTSLAPIGDATTKDIFLAALIRIPDQLPAGSDTMMIHISPEATTGGGEPIANALAERMGIGVRMDAGGVGQGGFVAEVNRLTGTPAVVPMPVDAAGRDFWVIGLFTAPSPNAGNYGTPKLWVFEDNDVFSLLIGSPHAQGTGLTGQHSNSQGGGASAVRIRTANLTAGDVYRVDSIIIAQSVQDIIDDTLSVDLVSFKASASGAGSPVTITWETSAEHDNSGFNIYRAANGAPGQKLNAFPIAAQGTETEGASYSFVDSDPIGRDEVRGYFLEDVEFSGTKTLHGPVRVGPFTGTRSSVDSWALYN